MRGRRAGGVGAAEPGWGIKPALPSMGSELCGSSRLTAGWLPLTQVRGLQWFSGVWDPAWVVGRGSWVEGHGLWVVVGTGVPCAAGMESDI